MGAFMFVARVSGALNLVTLIALVVSTCTRQPYTPKPCLHLLGPRPVIPGKLLSAFTAVPGWRRRKHSIMRQWVFKFSGFIFWSKARLQSRCACASFGIGACDAGDCGLCFAELRIEQPTTRQPVLQRLLYHTTHKPTSRVKL